MHIGELVWVRNGPENPTWGIIVTQYSIYLTDNSVMVSYEVLVDSEILSVDKTDILRFHYYNKHLLLDDTINMENR